MNFSILRRGMLAAVACLISIGGAVAQPVTVIQEGDTITAMQGGLVVSKYNEATGESSQYIYISGLLWQAANSDGTVNGYFYDADGKLLRIETQTYVRGRDGKLTETSVAGKTQHAVYAGDKLIALVSSTGARLAIDPSQAQPGDVVMRVKAPKGRPTAMSGLAAADKKKSFNHRMIAIHGWETRPAEWECTKTLDGEDICIGRGPGGGGGGPAPPYEPGPQPDGPPPGHGAGSDDGIGGGGKGGDGSDVNFQVRPDLPTRPSCLQAAYNTYVIMMERVCKMPKRRMICEVHAFVLWEEHVRYCTRTYPA